MNKPYERLNRLRAELAKHNIGSHISHSPEDVAALSATKKPSYEVCAETDTYDIWYHRKNRKPRPNRMSLTLEEVVEFYKGRK